MVDLTPGEPFAQSGLPMTFGTVTLAAFSLNAAVRILPDKGKGAAASADFRHHTGHVLPSPGRSCRKPGDGHLRVLWAGRSVWLGYGDADAVKALASEMNATSAVIDQSDALAGLVISGRDVRDVLARVISIDLDPDVFGDGATARTRAGHVDIHILRDGDHFILLVPQTLSGSVLHEVALAAKSIAAQAKLRKRGES